MELEQIILIDEPKKLKGIFKRIIHSEKLDVFLEEVNHFHSIQNLDSTCFTPLLVMRHEAYREWAEVNPNLLSRIAKNRLIITHATSSAVNDFHRIGLKAFATHTGFEKIGAYVFEKMYPLQEVKSRSFSNIPIEDVKNDLMFKISISDSGMITDWCDVSTKMLGYSRCYAVGKRLDEVLSVRVDWHSGLKSAEELSPIYQKLRKKNGQSTVIFGFLVHHPVHESQFTFIGYELQNHHERMEELNNYKFAFESFSMAVATLDENGQFIQVNENFTSIYGFSESEAIGQHHNILRNDSVHADLYEYPSAIWDTEKRWRREIIERTKDGDTVWVDKTISVLRSRSVGGAKYLIISRDVTQRKKIEQEIQKNIIMERSLRIKDEFMANMSHEIRTPLNSILGYSELLLESELSKDQYKQISTIRKSGRLLLSLINDILDLSKLDSGKLVLDDSEFDIREAFHSVQDMLEPTAMRKDLEFKLVISPEVPNRVIGDAVRTEQILVNLINNAIKFTKIGFVKVMVNLVSTSSSEARIEISVIDSGIGIPKAKLSDIFESFTQSTKYITREYGGTGLGLTIVKKLIDHMSGSIEVESEEHEGSEFRVVLPFKKAASHKGKSLEHQIAKNSFKGNLGFKILVAEDNEFNTALIKARLESWNCTVHIAQNGLEAVEMSSKETYDLLLMDIQMPVLDGYEATSRIRSSLNEHQSTIPILALTAHASNGDAKRAIQAGFNDYLFKPIDSSILYSKLIKHIHSEHDQLRKYHKLEPVPSEIDFSYIESEALGHPNIVKMLIELFLKEFERFIKDSISAVASEDWNGVYKAVHRVSPSVSNFNMSGIKQYTQRLFELSSNEESTHEYADILESAKSEYLKIKPILIQKVNQIKTSLNVQNTGNHE